MRGRSLVQQVSPDEVLKFDNRLVLLSVLVFVWNVRLPVILRFCLYLFVRVVDRLPFWSSCSFPVLSGLDHELVCCQHAHTAERVQLHVVESQLLRFQDHSLGPRFTCCFA